MRIGIDGQSLAADYHCGLRTYAKNLIFALAEIDKKNQYLIFSKKKVKIPKQKNFKLKVVKNFFPILRGIAYEQIFLPLCLKKEKLDLVHFLGYTGPVFYSGKKIFTIHDLRVLWKIFPFWKISIKYFINDIYERILARFLGKKEKNFLFCSNFTRKYFNYLFKRSFRKQSVVYEGVAEEFKKRHMTETLVKFREDYGLTKNFLLAMGDFSPHKNLEGVIKAYALLPKKIKNNFSLVILLSTDLQKRKLISLAEELKLEESILFFNNVFQKDLVLFYKTAFCFVFPSLFEGFGLPVIEAMACGCPVICSNITSLPEIAGGAALLVDPYKPEEISKAMEKLIGNKKIYKELKHKGLKMAKNFSWEKTAKETLKFYQKNSQEIMKICLVTSVGGHLYQVLFLKEWWSKHQHFWVTFDKEDSRFLLKGEKVYYAYFPENRNLVNAIKNTFLAWKILRKEKPDLVFSIGAGIAPPFFLMAKLLKIKTLFIEPFDFIKTPSLSGRLIYPFADKFLVQHKSLLARYPKAEYRGAVL